MLGRCSFFLFLLWTHASFGFNIDTKNFVTFEEPFKQNDAMFGYSISLYQTSVPYANMLIVGSPNVSSTLGGEMSGAAYLCDFQLEKCTLMDKLFTNMRVHKAGQMLGATITSDSTGTVVVCAPKYYVSLTQPKGKCFQIQRNFSEIKQIQECTSKYCQRGFSAALSKTDNYFGDPGFDGWGGSCSNGDTRCDFHTSVPQQFSYSGYSMTVGNLYYNIDALAVGMPRNLKFGAVTLFDTRNLGRLYYIIKGEQYGAYFGYSLATGNFDGDKKHDLIVSAPMYSRENIENGYETGRVYIYQQSKSFEDPIHITGRDSQSRFGTAVCSLGDINNDKIDDFAISAPNSGTGKVYIYHGSNQLEDNMEPTQVLQPASPNIRTFGFSLAARIDVDYNGYPDIAIGALEANQVFVYKTRPIVDVDGFLWIDGPIRKDAKCVTTSQKSPCTIVNSCVSYTGVGTPQNLTFQLNLMLDIEKPKNRNSRVLFIDDLRDTKTVKLTLNRNSRSCQTYEVQQNENNFWGYIPEIKVQVELQLVTNDSEAKLQPILNERTSIKPITLPIQKDCEKDCYPNLQLRATTTIDSYIYSDNKDVDVNIVIRNDAHDAFDTVFRMMIPPGFSYKSLKRWQNRKLDCSFSKESDIICDLPNPLRKKDGFTNFTITLLHRSDELSTSQYELTLTVNSSNPEREETMGNNAVTKVIQMTSDANLVVNGKSDPGDTIIYDPKVRELPENGTDEEMLGPELIHTYSFKNTGRTKIETVEASIVWPANTLDDDPILYLLEEPKTTAGIECHLIQPINPRNVQLSNKSNKTLENIENDITENVEAKIISKRQISWDKPKFKVSYVTCIITSLTDIAQISLRFRIVVHTLQKLTTFNVTTSTNCTAIVTKLPLDMNSTHKDVDYGIVNFIRPIPIAKDIPTLWLIILSADMGTLILLGTVVLLWRLGFFKRQKIPTEDEVKVLEYAEEYKNKNLDEEAEENEKYY